MLPSCGHLGVGQDVAQVWAFGRCARCCPALSNKQDRARLWALGKMLPGFGHWAQGACNGRIREEAEAGNGAQHRVGRHILEAAGGEPSSMPGYLISPVGAWSACLAPGSFAGGAQLFRKPAKCRLTALLRPRLAQRGLEGVGPSHQRVC